MEFAAAFIEYLVTGTCALAWLLPAIAVSYADVAGRDKSDFILLLPFVYVLGMLVDFIAEKAVSKVKRSIQKEFFGDEIAAVSTVLLAFHCAELCREFSIRSTRDRISRGAALNAFLLLLVVAFRPQTVSDLGLPLPHATAMFFLFVLTVLCLAMWWKYERLSCAFKLEAKRVIEKERRAASRNSAGASQS